MFNIGWILDVKKKNKSEFNTVFMLLVTAKKTLYRLLLFCEAAELTVYIFLKH